MRIFPAAPADTRARTPIISLCSPELETSRLLGSGLGLSSKKFSGRFRARMQNSCIFKSFGEFEFRAYVGLQNKCRVGPVFSGWGLTIGPVSNLVCTVQLETLCVARSLAILYLFATSGPGPRELPGFWGSMVFRHAPILRKGSSNNKNNNNAFFALNKASSQNLIYISVIVLFQVVKPLCANAA